jgi:hypothetical protein
MKEYVWLPENFRKYRSVLAGFSALWMTVCLLLVIPGVRSGILFFLEQILLNRPFENPLRWHQTLLAYGLIGISTPVLFLSLAALYIRHNDFFKNKRNIKIICGGGITLITIIMIWFIMYHAQWILSDDHMFLSTTAVNKYLPLDIYNGGRFFPLGHFHYNVLLVLSHLLQWESIPAAAHFWLNTAIYIVSSLLLYLLFRDIEPAKSKNHPYIHAFFLCFLPFFSSSCVMIFMQCIFPETILTALLSAFMFCYYRAFKTNKTAYYIIAFLAALYSTYCKEPVFGMFVIIALTNLIYGHKQQLKRGRVFHIALLVNALVFIVLYYLVSYSKAEGLYNEGRVEQNIIKSFVIILIQNKFFLFMIPLCIIRLFFVLVRKDLTRLYYDSLLFAGAGYIGAYIILRLNASYYFFPAVILSLPGFVYWSKYLCLNNNKIYLALFLAPLLMIGTLNLGDETLLARDIILQRKNTMPFINNLITNYENGKKLLWHEQDDPDAKNTFYITARNWQKHVINAFMSYVTKTDRDYLAVEKDIGHLDKNDILLYPRANRYYQPVPEDVLMILRDRGFKLDVNFFDVYVYKYAGE